MHLKTNIEHSPVQIIVLAMCPLLLAVASIYEAVFFLCGTIICLIFSHIFLMMFNRYLTNDVKTLLTALLSAMIVAVSSIAIKEFTDKVLPDNAYLMVFSTTILNAEFIYFNNKAMKKHYFMNILKILFIYSVMMVVYAAVKEFMSLGSIWNKQLFKFDGFVFCDSIIFDLLWLASLCAISDFVVRKIDKSIETKHMVYQKYVRIIRSEKAFQYDKLRREKLLANSIEVNRINKTDSEKIKQKEAENEAIESVDEIVAEEDESSEISESDVDATETSATESVESGEDKNAGKKSKKKNKKEGKK